jgi:hypothetical protein
MEYDAFIYGGGGPDVDGADKSPTERSKLTEQYLTGQKPAPYPHNLFPGATHCLTELVEAGITVTSYRNVKSCQRLEEMFAVVNGRATDDYCMPSLGPPPPKAGQSSP